MSLVENELISGNVLQEDLYKDNTLILKRGSVLNDYLLNKLNKFGLENICISNQKTNPLKNLVKRVLIIQKNELDSMRTRNVLHFAGFSNSDIICISDLKSLKTNINLAFVKYIFIDSKMFDKSLIDEIFLKQNNRNVKIFVMNCDNVYSQNYKYNNDFQNIKFLYRTLDKNYIKALISLYS